jgi:predicted DNA-binding transcriptional regulator AlpA
MEKLLNEREAANLLQLSPGTLSVWRTTKRYPLRYIKVGRSVRYRESDIAKFLDSRSTNELARVAAA